MHVPNVELGHHEGKCSFDAIIEKYNLEDRALQELAKIVRGADTDQPDPPPESIGLEAIAEGFRQSSKIRSDRKRLCLRPTITSDMKNPKKGIRTEASNPTGPNKYMGSNIGTGYYTSKAVIRKWRLQ